MQCSALGFGHCLTIGTGPMEALALPVLALKAAHLASTAAVQPALGGTAPRGAQLLQEGRVHQVGARQAAALLWRRSS